MKPMSERRKPTSDRKDHKKIFKVVFFSQGQVYEVYAKSVGQGGLFGFVEVEGLLFGEKTSAIVDPSEESLKREFDGVERTYIPMHSVLRIDEVEKRGTSKVHAVGDGAKVTSLPSPIYTPIRRDK
jgi:hypothetical protein